MKLSEQEIDALADDFEAGWDDERLDVARQSFGPGVADLLPAFLFERLEEKARQDGKSDFEVITDALKAYLIPA